MNHIARVVHLIRDVDMRNSHDGLAELAKKVLSVDTDRLAPGEFVMYVNTSQTMVKLQHGRWLLSYKKPDRSRLNAKALLALPSFAQGADIGYEKALASIIRKEYGGSNTDH